MPPTRAGFKTVTWSVVNKQAGIPSLPALAHYLQPTQPTQPTHQVPTYVRTSVRTQALGRKGGEKYKKKQKQKQKQKNLVWAAQTAPSRQPAIAQALSPVSRFVTPATPPVPCFEIQRPGSSSPATRRLC
jgi:hypothetical protein